MLWGDSPAREPEAPAVAGFFRELGVRGTAGRVIALAAVSWFALSVTLAAGRWEAWRSALGGMYSWLGASSPISVAGSLSSLLSHSSGILYLVGMLLAAYGAGWPLRIWLMGSRPGPANEALRLAFGWSVISLIQQGVGLSGLAFGSVLGTEAVLLVLAGTLSAAVRKPWRGLRRPRTEEFMPLFFVACILLVLYATTRLPDNYRDPLVYHLAVPEQCLLLHKIILEPGHFYWTIPSACEMLYLIPWQFGGAEAAKLLSFGFLLTMLGLAYGLTTSMIARGTASARWTLFWLASANVVGSLCWTGKNDLSAVMFVTAATVCAARIVGGSSAMLPALGWFLGQALGAKLVVVFPLSGLLIGMVIMRRFRLPWRLALAGALCAGAPLAGWSLQNLSFTGNPFFPLFSGAIPTLNWAPEYADGIRRFTLICTDVQARRPVEILSGISSIFGGDNGSIALLSLLPLAFLARQGPIGRLLKIAIAFSYFFWLFTERTDRFMFGLLPWAAVLGSGALARLEGKFPWKTRFATVVIASATLFTSLMGVAVFTAPAGLFYLVGAVEKDAVMEKRFTTWERVRRWVNASLPPDSKLIFLGETRRLWFNGQVDSFPTVHEPYFWKLTRESWTAEQVRKRVKQRGYTHCLFNVISSVHDRLYAFPGPSWRPRQLSLYQDFVSRYMRPIHVSPKVDWDNGGFCVYSFVAHAGFGLLPVPYLPSAEGIFWRSIELEKAGRYAEAIQETARMGALVSGSLHWREILATQLWAVGEYEQILSVLAPAIRAGFVGENVWRLYGGAALNTGRYDASVKALAKAWLLTPSPEILRWLSLAYAKRGKERAKRGDNAGALKDKAEAARLARCAG